MITQYNKICNVVRLSACLLFCSARIKGKAAAPQTGCSRSEKRIFICPSSKLSKPATVFTTGTSETLMRTLSVQSDPQRLATAGEHLDYARSVRFLSSHRTADECSSFRNKSSSTCFSKNQQSLRQAAVVAGKIRCINSLHQHLHWFTKLDEG